jgi:uncharacterized protein with FMN-binding domain
MYNIREVNYSLVRQQCQNVDWLNINLLRTITVPTRSTKARLTKNTNPYMRVSPKVSGLTYKSRAKWKMLRGIYSAIYGEFNVSLSVCVEIKCDYIEK